LGFFVRWRLRTPGPPPFSSMKFDACLFSGAPHRQAVSRRPWTPRPFQTINEGEWVHIR
jgi:hypothetical protein